SGFATLHTFGLYNSVFGTNSDGTVPQARLVLSRDTLYGTAYQGGPSIAGTVFAVNTDGTGFNLVHSFTGAGEGWGPRTQLVLSGGILYGTTDYGDSYWGTVFAVATNGTGFRTLHSFSGGYHELNSVAGLILSDNTLYGIAPFGSADSGKVFALNTEDATFLYLPNYSWGSSGWSLNA